MTPLIAGATEPIATKVSSDQYQTAWLELQGGGVELEGKTGAPFDVKLFLGLRDGRAVTAWFANTKLAGPRIVWLDQTTIDFDGKSLRGELRGRTNLNWGGENSRRKLPNVVTNSRGERLRKASTSPSRSKDRVILRLSTAWL